MKFWDSSAIVPLLIDEAATDRLSPLPQRDVDMIVWWATPVECGSAISRRERTGDVDASTAVVARERLDALRARWREVAPSKAVQAAAMRLVRVHALSAADALQLAAALAASEREDRALDFVCLDGRLAAAAQREGFTIVA